MLRKIKKAINYVLPKNYLGDYLFVTIDFLLRFKRAPVKNHLFNNYLYHLKLSEEFVGPLRTFVSDKYLVKHYIKSILGEEYVVPTLLITNDYLEVEEFLKRYQNNCVIKPAHSSGVVRFNKRGELIPYCEFKKMIDCDSYYKNRERNYRYLSRRVIIEPVLYENESLDDIKVFCFKGKAKAIQVDRGRFKNHSRFILNTKWEKLPITLKIESSNDFPACPSNLGNILEAAEKLSGEFSFVRIDFYTNNESLFVGEITNLHGAGTEAFSNLVEEALFSKILFDEHCERNTDELI